MSSNTCHNKSLAAQALKESWETFEGIIPFDRKLFLTFPDRDLHKGHLTNKKGQGFGRISGIFNLIEQIFCM